MTTLHLIPASGHQTAAQMRQAALTCLDHAQALRRAVSSLDAAWQGPFAEYFTDQAQAVARQIEAQAEALQVLAERLQREVTEWEETDRRGAESLRGAGFLYPPVAGGGGLQTFFLPLFTALQTVALLQDLPLWLRRMLDRLFPPPPIRSPVVEEPLYPKGKLYEVFKKLDGKSSQVVQRLHIDDTPASDSAKAASNSATTASNSANLKTYDVYHDVPILSQGREFGNAACLPTSLSMITEYYHAKDSNLKTASASDLIQASDPGDGTSGSGFGVGSLNDEMADLGYNATTRVGSMDDLKSALSNGPVIANIKVNLIRAPARDIQPGNAYNHSVVVKGINADSVVINDPWSGTEKVFSRADFEKMWSGGGQWMITVEPKK